MLPNIEMNIEYKIDMTKKNWYEIVIVYRIYFAIIIYDVQWNLEKCLQIF